MVRTVVVAARAAGRGGHARRRGAAAAAEPAAAAKVYRIGVISAAIEGKPQKTNGHTWHFAQYFHPEINLAAIKKYLDPGSARDVREVLPQPALHLRPAALSPTRASRHVYADPADGLRTVTSRRSPACGSPSRWRSWSNRWMRSGWATPRAGRRSFRSGRAGPGRRAADVLRQADRRHRRRDAARSSNSAKKHGAPLMSSSLFRHEFGMEQALRLRDSRRIRADCNTSGEHGRRLLARGLVHLRPPSGLDGGDAVRAGRGGGQHVRPRGRPPTR